MSNEFFPEGTYGLSTHYHMPADQLEFKDTLIENAESEGGAYELLMTNALEVIEAMVSDEKDVAYQNMQLIMPGYMYEDMPLADADRADGKLLVGSLVPKVTLDVLQQVFAMTGAKVVIDDRKYGFQSGTVIRQACYRGKLLYFVEQYDNQSIAWHRQPTLMVQAVSARHGGQMIIESSYRQLEVNQVTMETPEPPVNVSPSMPLSKLKKLSDYLIKRL